MNDENNENICFVVSLLGQVQIPRSGLHIGNLENKMMCDVFGVVII